MKALIRGSLWAVLAGAMTLATSPTARADLQLKLQEDGGTVVTVFIPSDNNGPVIYNGGLTPGGAVLLGGDFTIAFAAGASNSPGDPTSAIGQAGSFSIRNNTGTTHTLHLSVSAPDFTSPNSPPPLNLMDTFSGTLVNGQVTGNIQGFADATNVLFGTGTAASNLMISAMGASQSVSANGSPVLFSPNGATYSLSLFANLTLTGGSLLTGSLANVQTVPTPEPTTLASAGIAFILLGGMGWLRRRKQQG